MINQGQLSHGNKHYAIDALRMMGEYGRSKGVRVGVETRGNGRGRRRPGRRRTCGTGCRRAGVRRLADRRALVHQPRPRARGGGRGTNPAGPPPLTVVPAWVLLSEVIKESGTYANVDMGNVGAQTEGELFAALRTLIPMTTGNTHTRVNQYLGPGVGRQVHDPEPGIHRSVLDRDQRPRRRPQHLQHRARFFALGRGASPPRTPQDAVTSFVRAPASEASGIPNSALILNYQRSSALTPSLSGYCTVNQPPREFIRVPQERLRSFVSAAGQRVGLPIDKAELLAMLLVENDLRGVFSHGTTQIATYAILMRDGKLNPEPDVRVIKETPVSVIVDGDGGLGYFPSYEGTQLVIAKAKQAGIAVMLSRNHGHFGAAGIYARMTLGHDLLCYVTSGHQLLLNAGQPIYDAAGGSPMAFTAPTDGGGTGRARLWSDARSVRPAAR